MKPRGRVHSAQAPGAQRTVSVHVKLTEQDKKTLKAGLSLDN